MDVYTHFQHTFMFKQLEKWILHPITPLKTSLVATYWRNDLTCKNNLCKIPIITNEAIRNTHKQSDTNS